MAPNMNTQQLIAAKKAFFIALAIDATLTLISLFTNFWAVGVLEDYRSGRIAVVSSSTIEQIELSGSFSRVLLISFLVVGFTLVRWLGECYKYAAEKLNATGFEHETYKWIGWLVPVLNLYKPYKVISEVFKLGSQENTGGDSWKKTSSSNLLLAWWIFWLISHMAMWAVGKQSFRSSFKNDLTLDQIIGLYYGSFFVLITSLVVIGLWYIVAEQLTTRLAVLTQPIPLTPSTVSNKSMHGVDKSLLTQEVKAFSVNETSQQNVEILPAVGSQKSLTEVKQKTAEPPVIGANPMTSRERFLFAAVALLAGYVFVYPLFIKQTPESAQTAAIAKPSNNQPADVTVASEKQVTTNREYQRNLPSQTAHVDSVLIGGKISDGYASGQKIHMIGGSNGGKPYVGFILNIEKRTEDGLVLSGDFKTAFLHYKQLESQGDLTAVHNLGLMYLRGLGVDKDVSIALTYLEKSMTSLPNYATAKVYYDKALKENGQGTSKK